MSRENKGNLYILLTALLWSTGGILIKYIPGNAMMINGARSLIALLFFWICKRRIKVKVNKKIVAAAMCLVFTNLLYVIANKLTTAANAIVLQYTAPIFVLIWDCNYQRKKPEKYQCLVVVMAFSGMILFFFDQLDGGRMMGNLLAICAGICFSGVYFLNSLPESSSEDASMIAFCLSFIIALPFMKGVFLLNRTALLALLALGIFQVGLAYVFFSRGSRMTSPVNASLIGLMEAILNPVWVFLFYGERIGRFALAGAVIILTAVITNIILGDKQRKEKVKTNRTY